MMPLAHTRAIREGLYSPGMDAPGGTLAGARATSPVGLRVEETVRQTVSLRCLLRLLPPDFFKGWIHIRTFRTLFCVLENILLKTSTMDDLPAKDGCHQPRSKPHHPEHRGGHSDVRALRPLPALHPPQPRRQRAGRGRSPVRQNGLP